VTDGDGRKRFSPSRESNLPSSATRRQASPGSFFSASPARGPPTRRCLAIRIRLQALEPARLFLLASLLFGLPLLFLTPPFQVPDEPAHFLRAYAISQGRLLPERAAEGVGSELPLSLLRLIELTMAEVTFQPDQRFAPRVLAEAMTIELEPAQHAFATYPTSAVYSALPYLPQALGILFGRAVSDRPLVLLYCGRSSNFVAATALIAIALAQLPALRSFVCVVALCPMAMYLRASISPDAIALAMAASTAALVARMTFATPIEQSRRRRGWLLVAATALCLTKLPYAPLALAAAMVPSSRVRASSARRSGALETPEAASPFGADRGSPGKSLSSRSMASSRATDRATGRTTWRRSLPRPDRFAVTAVVLLAGTTTLSLLLALRVGSLDIDDRVDPGVQVANAMEHPWSFARVVVSDWVVHAPRYAAELIGRLGWLDTPLPLAFLAAFAAALVFLAVADGRGGVAVPLPRRVVLGGLLLASAGLISAAQYASWTPVGADRVLGIQGRYFLPLMPFAGFVCVSQRASARAGQWTSRVAWLAVAASGVVTLVVLAARFWVG